MTAVRRAVAALEKGGTGEPSILIRPHDIEDAIEEVLKGMV